MQTSTERRIVLNYSTPLLICAYTPSMRMCS